MGAQSLLKQFRNQDLLVDTNPLIYHLNDKLDLSQELASAKSLNISAVTQAELYAGTPENKLRDMQEFLEEFNILPVSDKVSTLAGAYLSKLQRTNLKDMVIAVTADIYKLKLVTANKKDFIGLTSLKPIFIEL